MNFKERMIDKTLLFTCPVYDGITNTRAYKIHCNCLRYFHNVFSDAIIILNIKDGTSQDTINEVELFFCNLGINNITIKKRNETLLYESYTFYNDFICDIDRFKNLVFFSHMKGLTNYKTGYDMNIIDEWILGLYFQSLYNVEYVEGCLVNSNNPFYGSFLTYYSPENRKKNEPEYAYSGSFFWIKPSYLKNRLSSNDVPQDRWYVEYFVDRHLYDDEKPPCCYNTRYMCNSDPYLSADRYNRFVLGDDYDKFLDFKNKMLENIDIYE